MKTVLPEAHPSAPADACADLPDLPRPSVCYADQSYPAFSAAQMQAYARAALARGGAPGEGWTSICDEPAPVDSSKFDAHCIHPETGGFGGRIPDVQMRGDRSGFGIMIPERGGAVWAYLDGRDGIIAPWRMTHWRRQPAPPASGRDGAQP